MEHVLEQGLLLCFVAYGSTPKISIECTQDKNDNLRKSPIKRLASCKVGRGEGKQHDNKRRKPNWMRSHGLKVRESGVQCPPAVLARRKGVSNRSAGVVVGGARAVHHDASEEAGEAG